MKVKKILAVLTAITVMFTFTCVPAFAETTLEKEETVYVITDAEGTTEKTTVSERLKTEEKGAIADRSNLMDIRNVKGDETFKQDGEYLSWKAEGEDIYYQGTSEKALPIKMKISYYMNGIEKTPESMAGKSGKFKIRVEFEAVEGVPFAAVSVLSLDGNRFRKVTVNSGEIISTGDSLYVAGVALPGMDSLLSKFDAGISSYIEIKGTCRDFETSDIYTVLTKDLMEGIDTDKINLDNLEESLNSLTDASEQLVDGSSKLSDGLNELNSKYKAADKGIKAFADGAGKLDAGLEELKKKMPQLTAGGKKLSNGAATINDGVKTMKGKMPEILSGSSKLSAGAKDLDDGVKKLQGNLPELVDGGKDLAAGAKEIDRQVGIINGKMPELKQGTAKAEEGAKKLQESLKGTQDAIGDFKEATDPLKDLNADALKQQLGGLAQGISDVNNGLGTLQSKVTAANETEEALIAALIDVRDGYEDNGIPTDDLNDIIDGLSAVNSGHKQAAGELASDGDLRGGLSEMKQGIGNIDVSGLAGLPQIPEKLGDLYEVVGKEADGAKDLSDGLGDLKKGVGNLTDGLGTLSEDGTAPLAKGASDLSEGLVLLQEGVMPLKTGTGTLAIGAKSLDTGLNQLASGAKELAAGTQQLADGTGTLSKNLVTLKKGTNTLAEGSGQIVDGAVELQKGSRKISSGIGELSDGGDDLSEGLGKFDKEGIRRLSGLYDEYGEDTISQIEGLVNQAKSYESYGGNAESETVTLKFIVKSKGISVEKEKK